MGHTDMRRIAVVTDSTSDIPDDLMEKYHIRCVPLQLALGGETWRDRMDICPEEFYALLQKSTDFPSTSQPSAGTFEALFHSLSEDYEGIVAVLVSGGISGTLAAARSAAAQLPNIPIEIIDSRGTAMMLGFPVLAAAKAAHSGGDLDMVAHAARSLVAVTNLYFVVDTLDYLYRGGRIGLVGKLLGSSLNIKPIIQFRDGVACPVTRVRTMHKAQEKVCRLIGDQFPQDAKLHMAVFHVAALEQRTRLRQMLEECFRPVEMLETDCSPVLGAHAGPGTVGVAYYAE